MRITGIRAYRIDLPLKEGAYNWSGGKSVSVFDATVVEVQTPLDRERLNRRMDAALQGHPYVKSGLDMACWDILGKVANQPVCTLLGGRYEDDFVLYRAIS